MIGNGPSLRQAPFDLLHNEYTFGMNRIGLITEYTDWMPRFYCYTSERLQYDPLQLEYIISAAEQVKVAFIWNLYQDTPELSKRHNITWISLSQIEGSHNKGAGQNEWWSDDAGERVSKYGSAMFPALQIATYLGFSPLYVIGADGYRKLDSDHRDINHFHPKYRVGDRRPPGTINEHCKRVYEIAVAAGVEIYDASQSEGYGVLSRVDLLEVLSESD